MLEHCRVCNSELGEGFELAHAPSLSSVLGQIDAPTFVNVCDVCSHAQSENLPNIAAYYDNQYRISLDSEQHDQLLTSPDLKTTAYRTDYQAKLCMDLCDIPPNAQVLDFGAAQAKSLIRLTSMRPDIVPHVFDVSADYRNSWNNWLPAEQQATYEIPNNWRQKFDLVTSYFVLEHVDDPVGYLSSLVSWVKPEGQIFVSFPSVDANPGDMIVADHLNHFSLESLVVALNRAGLSVLKIENDPLLCSFFVLAKVGTHQINRTSSVSNAVDRNREICLFWKRAGERLRGRLQQHKIEACAIYGAGFYGSWLKLQIEDSCNLTVFVDMNERLWGNRHLGLAIVSPADLPSNVKTVFVGLNPLRARQIIASVVPFQKIPLNFVWLD